MPTPTKTETKSRFVSRCIPEVMAEGRGRKQSMAICYSLWAQSFVSNQRKRNTIRMDPTRTTMLRRRFVAEVNKRFRWLKGQILRLVVQEDAFGIGSKGTTFNVRWAPLTDPNKVEEFKVWVQEQVDAGILSNTDITSSNWMEQYIKEAHDKGKARAFDDYRKGYAKDESTADFYRGTKEEFLRSAFDRAASEDKVRLLAQRAYTDLANVTGQMATQMNRVVTDGLIRGDSPRRVATELNKTVDKIGIVRARTIARTETIRAHAEGQLDALEKLGVEELGVMVEWSTTGDDRVCQLCLPLEGVVMKMREARGTLPRHPNCRCAWIPANVGEQRKASSRRSKARIERARDRSLVAESPKYDPNDPRSIAQGKRKLTKKERLELAQKRSKWQGADAVISKERPDAIVKEAFSSQAKRQAALAIKASNLGPTLAAEVAKEAGVSPGIAKIAMLAATIGDFTVPGLPVGSAAVTALASIKSPMATTRVARRIILELMRLY
jgi:SPP1 gp7 family putative phage head morphogenesis protein